MTKTTTQKATPVKSLRTRFRTLDDEVKSPEADVDVLGVILDCTGHYKTNNSFDYITKIKIIDRTHNPLTNAQGPGSRIEGAVTAYVFSEKVSAAPVVVKVGDILLLRHVAFNTYREQVSCKVRKNRSEWAVFDGRWNTPKVPISASANHAGLRKEDHAPLLALREWAMHFFINNSLLRLEWYRSQWPEQVSKEKTYQLKDVDIVVKVLGSVQVVVEGQKYQKIAFGDASRNFYFSELSYTQVELEADMVVKLRSVCIIRADVSMRIDFYNYSSILVLHENFKDAKALTAALAQVAFDAAEIESQFFEEFHLDKYRKRAISNSTFVYELEKDAKRPDLLGLFPILAEFAYAAQQREPHAASYVKNAHAALPPATLRELNDVLAAARKRGAAPAGEGLFRVKAQVVAWEKDSLEAMAHFYSTKARKTWPISAEVDFLAHKDAFVMFYNVFSLQDESLAAHTMPCYLSTFDGNPAYFFDLWKLLPDVYSVDQWKSLKPAKLSEFNKKLAHFLAQKGEYQLVLQLQKNEQGKFFFRIIDTILGFYR